jgi:hypothetical protein
MLPPSKAEADAGARHFGLRLIDALRVKRTQLVTELVIENADSERTLRVQS